MSSMSKRAPRSNPTDTDGVTKRSRVKKQNSKARVSRITCFFYITIVCLAISGIAITKYPSFIEANMHTNGDVEVKLSDVVTVPLKPDYTNLQDRRHYYMYPPTNATSDGKPKGMLLYLHSCKQSGLDFFTLPEHRIIAHDALSKGLLVFAPTSIDRDSGCFTSQDAERYLEKVVSKFVRRNRLESLPRVGMGYSSGGAFLSFLQKGLKLESMALYNSPEDYAELRLEQDALIPTVYLSMSSDGSISNRMNNSTTMLQERDIATNLYRASPKPFTQKLCAARLPEVTDVFCDHILETIQKDSKLIDRDGYVLEDDLMQWERIFQKLDWDYNSFVADNQLDDYERLTIPWNAGRSWLRVVLEQEIKTCYGYHAMTAQFHDEILDFLVANSNMEDDPWPSQD